MYHAYIISFGGGTGSRSTTVWCVEILFSMTHDELIWVFDNNLTYQALSFQIGCCTARSTHCSNKWSIFPSVSMSSRASHLPIFVNTSAELYLVLMKPIASSAPCMPPLQLQCLSSVNVAVERLKTLNRDNGSVNT
jgi:hypothetical protein